MQERSGRAHRAVPKAYESDLPRCAHVVALVTAKWNILAVGQAPSREVKAKNSDAQWEQRQALQRLRLATPDL